MPTMHNRQRRLTERELDHLLQERQNAAACAAQQIIDRARKREQERQRACPPCTGHCEQGDKCPARLAEQRLAAQRGAAARAKVDADASLSGLPLGPRWLALYLAVIFGTLLVSHAVSSGWFAGWLQ